MAVEAGASVAVEYDNSLIVESNPIKKKTTRERVAGTVAETSTDTRIVVNADNFNGTFYVDRDGTAYFEPNDKPNYEAGTNASIEEV